MDIVDIDYKMVSKFPFAQLKRFHALPIKEDEINLFVAFKNPIDVNAQEAIQRIAPRKLIKTVVSDPSKIDVYLNKIELGDSIKGLILEIRREITTDTINNPQESSGVLKLIDIILKTSILSRASDIHIEPTEHNCIRPK